MLISLLEIACVLMHVSVCPYVIVVYNRCISPYAIVVCVLICICMCPQAEMPVIDVVLLIHIMPTDRC